MSVEIEQIPLFDYTDLDTDTTTYLRQNAQETRGLLKRTSDDIIQIGRNLLAARDQLAQKPGQKGTFIRWIKAELGISQPTAWRFMQVAQGKPVTSFNVNEVVVLPPVEPNEGHNRVGNSPSLEERRNKVKKLFEDYPGSQKLSNREIAKRCDVDHKTVAAIKRELQEEEAARNTSVALPEVEPTPEPANETQIDEVVQELEQPQMDIAEPESPSEEIIEPDQISEEIEQEPPAVNPEAEMPAIESTDNPEWADLEQVPDSEISEIILDDEPETKTEETKQEPPVPTVSGVITPSEEVFREREIKRQQVQERNEQLREKGADLPTGKYACLVVDPPWPMKKIEREVRPNQVEFDYPTMTEDELKAFPLPDMAGDDCHLYLWTTQKYLPMALRLAEHWGFKYQCLMTWVKNVGPTPFSWMYTTEHVLFCSKGNLPLLAIGRRLDFIAKGREHSRKPDEFYEIVKEVSPGPRMDVFSREKREGFEQYGYETEKYVSA